MNIATAAITAIKGLRKKRLADEQESFGDFVKIFGDGEISHDGANAHCLEHGIELSTLQTEVNVYLQRKEDSTQLDASQEAASEVQRLDAELELNEAEAGQKMQPFRDRAEKLRLQREAAEKVSRAGHAASMRLRDSRPQWLLDALDQAQAEVNGPKKFDDYHRGKLRAIDQELDHAADEIKKLRRQLGDLHVRTSDYEGQKRQEAMSGRISILKREEKALRSERKETQACLSGAGGKAKKAQARLQKLESLTYKIWPKPSDVDV